MMFGLPKEPKKGKDRDEMLDKLWGAGFFKETSPSEYSDRDEPSTEVPSHMTIEIDPSDGSPVLARFTAQMRQWGDADDLSHLAG